MAQVNTQRVRIAISHCRRTIDALKRAMDNMPGYAGDQVTQDYICKQLGYASDQLTEAFREWALAHGRPIPSAVVGVFSDGHVDISRRRSV